MTPARRGASHAIIAALALSGCGDDSRPLRDAGADAVSDATALDAASDTGADAGGFDAGAAAAEMELRDRRGYVLHVGTAPFALELRDPTGDVLLGAPPEGAGSLELGVVSDAPDPMRFYDPASAAGPRGVHYVRASAVTELHATDGGLAGTVAMEVGPVALTLAADVVSSERVSDTPDRRIAFEVTLEASAARVVTQRFVLGSGDPEVGYYGLGELFDGANARGRVIPMQFQVGGAASGFNERHVPVPLVVSTRGWGLFAATRESGAFDLGATDTSRLAVTFEGRHLVLWLFANADPIETVADATLSQGAPRLPPPWAFGNMQWRNEWDSSDQVRGDIDRYRAEDIPLSVTWIDNPWQTSYDDSVFDETRFHDPPGLIADLLAKGVRTLIWSTPYLDALDADDRSAADADNTAEMLFAQARDAGWLVDDGSGVPFIAPSAPGASGAMIDFTNAAASDFWVGRLAPLVAIGIRGYKLDFAEDVVPELLGTRLGLRFSNGQSEREMHGVYARLYHRAYRRSLDLGAGGDGVVIGRASAWGGQTDVDVIWPGDLDNDFRPGGGGEVGGLPASVSALQSLAASGFPSFAADTGGFRHGMPERELLLRWAEHTALSPLMQLGGAGTSHNPWEYDDEAVRIVRELMRLHFALVPFWRANAVRASHDGLPPVRAMGLAFPDDAAAARATDEYLLGDALLVAPVIVPGVASRIVHVPRGRWVRWQDGSQVDGPADVALDAPIGTPIVLARAGAVVPMLPDDVVTMVATADGTIVDASDRADRRRVRIVLGAAGGTALEEGARVSVDGAQITIDPGASGIDRWVLMIDTPAAGAVTRVRVGASDASGATTRAEVEAYCDACWIDGGVGTGGRVVVGVRTPGTAPVTVRVDGG